MSITLFPIAIAPKPAIAFGKFDFKPVYHGDSARKSGNRAQTRDLRQVWGKSKRNPFIMAIPLFPLVLTPKPARVLGKIEAETVYHGDSLKKKRRSRQNRRPSTRLGKFSAEPVYLGDRETKHDTIGETIGIGEPFWVGETMRDGPCRRGGR